MVYSVCVVISGIESEVESFFGGELDDVFCWVVWWLYWFFCIKSLVEVLDEEFFLSVDEGFVELEEFVDW